MSRLLVLLMLVAILLSSPLLSEGAPPLPQNSFAGSSATDAETISASAEPGGLLEADVSNGGFFTVCIVDEKEKCEVDSQEVKSLNDHLPEGTELGSTNPDVASVNNKNIEVIFHKPGVTTLELRSIEDGRTLYYYRLVVYSVPAGMFCQTRDIIDGYMDCSGQCVPSDDIRQRLLNSKCDDGKKGQDIDVSCLFIPEVFAANIIPDLDFNFADSLERDRGYCTAKLSCQAQFGDAPDFELCTAERGVCRFNARTDGGTCEDMCRRFGSVCVAALANPLEGGCTPNTLEMDPDAFSHTCDTEAMTEICVCERR